MRDEERKFGVGSSAFVERAEKSQKEKRSASSPEGPRPSLPKVGRPLIFLSFLTINPNFIRPPISFSKEFPML
jgi:hypothetical protein